VSENLGPEVWPKLESNLPAATCAPRAGCSLYCQLMVSLTFCCNTLSQRQAEDGRNHGHAKFSAPNSPHLVVPAVGPTWGDDLTRSISLCPITRELSVES